MSQIKNFHHELIIDFFLPFFQRLAVSLIWCDQVMQKRFMWWKITIILLLLLNPFFFLALALNSGVNIQAARPLNIRRTGNYWKPLRISKKRLYIGWDWLLYFFARNNQDILVDQSLLVNFAIEKSTRFLGLNWVLLTLTRIEGRLDHPRGQNFHPC